MAKNNKTRKDVKPEKAQLQNRVTRLFGLLAKIKIRYLVLAIAVIAIMAYLGSYLTANAGAIESWFVGLGYWNIVVFATLFVVLTSFLLPESIFSVTAGAVFGFKLGIAVIMLSMVAACVVQYFVAKGLFKERIAAMLAKNPKLLAIQNAVIEDEFRLQLMLRLTPLNPAIISYMFGAAGVKIKGFIICCFAMLPLLCVEVYLGVLGKKAVTAAGLDSTSSAETTIENTIVIVGLVISIVVIYIISKKARAIVDKATSVSSPK